MMSRALIIVIAVGSLMLLGQAWPAGAQQPQPPPPAVQTPIAPARPGDVLWTFAQEPPFFDSRVALALATLIDKDLSTSIPNARIFYAEYRAPAPPRVYVGVPPAPIGEVKKLLTAAGFPNGLYDLREVGRCKVWSAPPPVGMTPAVQPREAADLLARLLIGALAEVGRPTQPCVATATIEDAHLLIWVEGGPPPIIPSHQQSTFLALPASAQVQPPGRGGNGAPRPARTGSGGQESRQTTPGLLLPVALFSAAGAIAVLARRRTAPP